MRGFTRGLQDLALLLVRLVVAGIMMMHAWHRWEAGPDKLVRVLAGHGVPYPKVFAWGTLGFESLGALLLVCGLATPIIGAVLIAQHVMLIVYAKWQHGLWVTDGGYEYDLAMAALGVVLLCFGAGRTGMDNLFSNEPPPDMRLIRDSDPA